MKNLKILFALLLLIACCSYIVYHFKYRPQAADETVQTEPREEATDAAQDADAADAAQENGVESDERRPVANIPLTVAEMLDASPKGYSTLDPKPLVVIDGRVTDYAELELISTKQVEWIDVVLAQKGMEVYGEAARGGVIVVATNRATNAAVEQTETEARFQGGDVSLFEIWLLKNLSFPADIVLPTEEVILQFDVSARGKLGNLKFAKGVKSDVMCEIGRVATSCPDWTPAMSAGKAVKSSHVLSLRLK